MDDEALLTKAFNAMKARWGLKDMHVMFWAGRPTKHPYLCRPYVCAVNGKGELSSLRRRDVLHVVDYVYVDEFNTDAYRPDSLYGTPRSPIQPFQLARALFKIAQDDPIYYVPPSVDPYYCDLSKHIMIGQGVQLDEFLVQSDLAL